MTTAPIKALSVLDRGDIYIKINNEILMEKFERKPQTDYSLILIFKLKDHLKQTYPVKSRIVAWVNEQIARFEVR